MTTPTTSTTAPLSSDACGSSSTGVGPPGVPSTTVPAATSWSEKLVLAGTCPQVVDLATGAGFSLVSQPPTDQGPWVLQRVDIDRATSESGPTFSVGALAVAAGYLWISCGRTTAGDGLGPSVCQVDPRTLVVVRQIRLPPPQAPAPGAYRLSVGDGPEDTVWVGYGQTLVHIAARDGRELSSVPIASGTVSSLSVDPEQRYLYVALSYPTVSGKTVDAAVLEFDARTGRALAGTSAGSAVTDSVSGGNLTAVPGGVWMSFRTGMLGETVLLRQSDLAVVAPPSADLADAQPDGVFRWVMGASTIYENGALLLVNQNGVLACVDPHTGAIRVQEHLADGEGVSQLLAVDVASARVFATDTAGLEAITPPPTCWR